MPLLFQEVQGSTLVEQLWKQVQWKHLVFSRRLRVRQMWVFWTIWDYSDGSGNLQVGIGHSKSKTRYSASSSNLFIFLSPTTFFHFLQQIHGPAVFTTGQYHVWWPVGSQGFWQYHHPKPLFQYQLLLDSEPLNNYSRFPVGTTPIGCEPHFFFSNFKYM